MNRNIHFSRVAALLFLFSFSIYCAGGGGGGGDSAAAFSFEITSAQPNVFTGDTVDITVEVTGSGDDQALGVYASNFTYILSSFDTFLGEITVPGTPGTYNFSLEMPCSEYTSYDRSRFVGFEGAVGAGTPASVEVHEGAACSGSSTFMGVFVNAVPASGLLGQSFSFDVNVSAGVSASSTSCSVYLSTDNNVTSGDRLVGSVSIAPTSGVQVVSVTLPTSGLGHGSPYYVGFSSCAGVTRLSSAETATVYEEGVYVETVGAPASGKVGESVDLDVTVQVFGSPGSLTCGVYVSLNSSISTSVDRYIQDIVLPATAGTHSYTVTIPEGTMEDLGTTSNLYLGTAGASSNCRKASTATVAVNPLDASAQNVSGQIQFEKPAVNAASYLLNTSSLTNTAARYVTVQLLNYNNAVVASTRTDGSGNYSLSGSVNGIYRIRTLAEMIQTGTPAYNIQVTDGFSGSAGSVYALESTVGYASSCGGSCTVNVTALDSNRGNGPFGILHTISLALDKLIAADGAISLPALGVRWRSNSTVGSYFTTSSTACVSVSNCMFLLGNRSSDSDEFDAHIVAHEFTHFLEAVQARSDSVGGAHYTDDLLEPRVAYGEGLGNAMAGIFLDDPDYADTANGGGFGFSLESESHSVSGFFSETSVQSIIWDLYDSANEGADNLSYGFSPLWTAVKSLKDIDGITYLHPFIASLKAANSSDTADINSILGMESVAVDEASEGDQSFAATAAYTGLGVPAHTCDGSTSDYAYLPIMQTVAGSGASAYSASHKGSQICGAVAPAQNKLFGSQFFLVTPSASGTMNIVATDTSSSDGEDPDVYVTRRGNIVGFGLNVGSENVNVSVTGGLTYVVEIRTYSLCMWGKSQGSNVYCNSNSGEDEYDVQINLP